MEKSATCREVEVSEIVVTLLDLNEYGIYVNVYINYIDYILLVIDILYILGGASYVYSHELLVVIDV